MTSFVSSLDNPSTGTPLVLYRIQSASAQVILTAPHGGSSKYGAQSALSPRPLVHGVVTKSDLHTLDLLALIDEYVRNRLTTRPHVVAARFHRQFIDANRNARIASQVAVNPDCVTSRQLYDEYHGHISNCIDHCIERDPHSRVLLLDLHGMKPYTDFIAVGSLNHMTHDTKITNKPYMGFLWHLRDLLGSTVLPLPGNNDFPQYSGGFTIQRHGTGSRVDAFQLEFGSFLRQLEVRKNVAAAIGEAIVRTLQPMESFLVRLRTNPLVGWSLDGVRAVQAKLKKANCYTPQDLHLQLMTINGQLVAHGARKFSRGTLQAMREALLLYASAHTTSTSSSSAVESNSNNDNSETTTGKGGNDVHAHVHGGTSNAKILPREFLELHYPRLWTPMGVVGVGHEAVTGTDGSRMGVEEGDSVGLRSIVRRIFLCPELLHLVLGRPQSEATAVQSYLEQACQASSATSTHYCDHINKGHTGGPLTSSQLPQKGGANHQHRDNDNNNDITTTTNNNNDCSSFLSAFWAEFFRSLSFSCTPAVCPGFDRNCHLRIPTHQSTPLSSPPLSSSLSSATAAPSTTSTMATRDGVHPASLEGFAVCFADASEFNQKLRAWQAFVTSCYAQSHSPTMVARGGEGEGSDQGSGLGSVGVVPTSGVEWGTAAALSLPVPHTNPYNKPHALRQHQQQLQQQPQQQQQQQSALVDFNPAESLPPPPPPKSNANANANAAPTTILSPLSHPLPLAAAGEDTLYQLVVFYVTCHSDS